MFPGVKPLILEHLMLGFMFHFAISHRMVSCLFTHILSFLPVDFWVMKQKCDNVVISVANSLVRVTQLGSFLSTDTSIFQILALALCTLLPTCLWLFSSSKYVGHYTQNRFKYTQGKDLQCAFGLLNLPNEMTAGPK